MFTDSTNLDIDSPDPNCMQLESVLGSLIQCDENEPSKKEERVARAQFLALCWTLFVVGWTDGTAGPLLPRIQIFYNVSWVNLFLWPILFLKPPINSVGRVRNSVLGICFAMYSQWCFVGSWYIWWRWRHVQGSIVGALLNMSLSDRLGLGKVSF